MKCISLLYMSLSNDFKKNGENEMGRYLLKGMGALFYSGFGSCLICIHMMTSSNGNFSALLALSDHRWIPLTKASDAELWCFLWFAPE